MKKYWPILVIFLLAFAVRFLSVWPANTIIGFDQARDLFDSAKILQGDLRIIGPTAGNNPNLHHGVLWLYFMAVPIAFSHNPIYVVLWNSLFNAFSVVVICLLANDLFKSNKVGAVAGIITAVSYYYVSFSGWLSNPTITLLTVPLFFFGVWEYYQKKDWGLPLSMLALGLSIQFELFFIYLIPVFILSWLILKLKFPKVKILFLSILALLISLSTMIATEIKFHFAGIKSLLSAGSLVGGSAKFDFTKLFSLNFWPQNKTWDLVFGLLVIGYLIYETVKTKETRKRNLFLLTWFFSPALMLLLGSHNAPWFMVGRPAAAIIMSSYLISKIKYNFLIVPVVGLIIYANCLAIKVDYGKGQTLLEPDKSALLSKQIAVMKYTYEKANNETFAIDTVTNPLYINAVWAWNYDWYYKTLPAARLPAGQGRQATWLGGDQLPPYNTLEKATGKEKYLFLIIDETPRIPPIYKENAINNLKKKATFVEEKDFDGILVRVYQAKF